MFGSILKVWQFNLDAEYGLVGNKLINFRFTDKKFFVEIIEVTDSGTKQLALYPFTNLDIMFSAMSTGQVSDVYAEHILTKFLHITFINPIISLEYEGREPVEHLANFKKWFPEAIQAVKKEITKELALNKMKENHTHEHVDEKNTDTDQEHAEAIDELTETT